MLYVHYICNLNCKHLASLGLYFRVRRQDSKGITLGSFISEIYEQLNWHQLCQQRAQGKVPMSCVKERGIAMPDPN